MGSSIEPAGGVDSVTEPAGGVCFLQHRYSMPLFWSVLMTKAIAQMKSLPSRQVNSRNPENGVGNQLGSSPNINYFSNPSGGVGIKTQFTRLFWEGLFREHSRSPEFTS